MTTNFINNGMKFKFYFSPKENTVVSSILLCDQWNYLLRYFDKNSLLGEGGCFYVYFKLGEEKKVKAHKFRIGPVGLGWLKIGVINLISNLLKKGGGTGSLVARQNMKNHQKNNFIYFFEEKINKNVNIRKSQPLVATPIVLNTISPGPILSSP